jgi:hypothetical protein
MEDLSEISVTCGIHILLLVVVLLGLLLRNGLRQARVASHLGFSLAPLLIEVRPDVVQPSEAGRDVAMEFRWEIATM